MSCSFHEMIDIHFELGDKFSAGKINRLLKELGATLHYDVYSFERQEPHPVWQSSHFAAIDLLIDDEEVDAQDGCDAIRLSYPLATIGSEYVSRFVNLVYALATKLECAPMFEGVRITQEELIEYCEGCITELMEKWGEEPGSETLTTTLWAKGVSGMLSNLKCS